MCVNMARICRFWQSSDEEVTHDFRNGWHQAGLSNGDRITNGHRLASLNLRDAEQATVTYGPIYGERVI